MKEVWRIIEAELPQLMDALHTLLPPLEQLEREVAGEDDGESSQSI